MRNTENKDLTPNLGPLGLPCPPLATTRASDRSTVDWRRAGSRTRSLGSLQRGSCYSSPMPSTKAVNRS